MTIEYDFGAELPTLALTLTTSAGDIVNMTAYGTVEVRIGRAGKEALFSTINTGLTKATTAPNLVVAWAAGDLTFPPSPNYRMTIEATDGSDRDRIWQEDFALHKVVLPEGS